MKISRGGGGWAELHQLPGQLRNELHSLHTGQEELGRWLELGNAELLGQAWPGSRTCHRARGEGASPGDSLVSVLCWPSEKASEMVSQAKNESWVLTEVF